MHTSETERDAVADNEVTTVRALLGQCKHAFIMVLILTLIIEMMAIVPVLYLLNGYDRVITSRSEITLVSLTALVVGAYIFWTGLELIRRRALVRISLRIDWELASDVFDASFRRNVGRKKLNVHQVLGDLVQLRTFMTGGGLPAIMSAPFSVFFIMFAALFHPYLAIFTLTTAAVLLILSYFTRKLSAPLLREANNTSAEATRIAAQSLRQSETALALGMHHNIRRQWYRRHQDALRLQVGATEAAASLGAISGFLSHALPSLQMGLGFYLAIHGEITGGMVIASNFLLRMSIKPIRQIMKNWKEIVSTRQSYERLSELIDAQKREAAWMELPPPIGNLSVSELATQPYGAIRPILADINFSMSPGEITAIVGPSAAGKSSLIKALVGVWPPSNGSVRLDGAEVSEWIKHSLGKYVGYVPQECEFFEGSIASNIARLGEVDAEKVTKAAMMAGVHEMILSFPKGYETMLGDNGHVLTGGQKQRIAIARAVYGDPCLVVMDEPNASLDESGERALMEVIRTLKNNGAVVVFSTHRAEMVHIADNLLVLKAGRQVGFGKVSDMLMSARKLRDATKKPNPVKADDAKKPGGGVAGAAA